MTGQASDLSNAPAWVLGFISVICALAFGFNKVYGWIQAENEKQRKAREEAEQAIRRDYEPRIVALESKITVLQQESTTMKKVIVTQVAEIFRFLDDPETHRKEIASCLKTILEAAG